MVGSAQKTVSVHCSYEVRGETSLPQHPEVRETLQLAETTYRFVAELMRRNGYRREWLEALTELESLMYALHLNRPVDVNKVLTKVRRNLTDAYMT